MKFIFWQSILSIHQSTFLNALSKDHEVTLVVEREFDEVRKQSGWTNPYLGCKRVIIAPDRNTVLSLIKDTADAIHVISGIEMTFQKYKLTQLITDLRYKVVCYLEPFKWIGLLGFARRLKYIRLRFKYGKLISVMLPTGLLGVNQYTKIGFKNVYEWGYFTEQTMNQNIPKSDSDSQPKLLFVGSLDERKNILSLIKLISNSDFRGIRLTIIGDGPLRNDVTILSSQNTNISYLGVKPNKEVKRIMSQHDILVLPSIFDGWGAVVNEALSSGMRVICSDRCGASTLLDKDWRGSVFNIKSSDDFSEKIKYQLEFGKQTGTLRERLVNWSHSNISGDAAASYFIDICKSQFLGLGNKPTAPWKKQ